MQSDLMLYLQDNNELGKYNSFISYLKSLEDSQKWVNCLEDAGVDNWEGISYAYELYNEYEN